MLVLAPALAHESENSGWVFTPTPSAEPGGACEPQTVCVSTGTHSLHYHYLTLSEPGPGLPRFLAVGYVDDQPFLRYDSRVGRAEPQAPWMASLDTQYWETETQKHRAWAEEQQVNLWTVMSYYNQSGGASGGPPLPSFH